MRLIDFGSNVIHAADMSDGFAIMWYGPDDDQPAYTLTGAASTIKAGTRS
jgi:hypothetical protein